MENVIRLLERIGQDIQTAVERLRNIKSDSEGLNKNIRLDLIENPSEYVSYVDLPGLNKNKITLNVSSDAFEIVADYDKQSSRCSFSIN